MGGKPLELVEVGGRFRWRWGGEELSIHEFLEIRPWTPYAIGGRLAFIARDGGTWSAFWGKERLVAADDAYDVDDWFGVPVFIARFGQVWQVRADSRVLVEAEGQLTFRLNDDAVEVFRFPRSRGDVAIARFECEPWQMPATARTVSRADEMTEAEKLQRDFEFAVAHGLLAIVCSRCPSSRRWCKHGGELELKAAVELAQKSHEEDARDWCVMVPTSSGSFHYFTTESPAVFNSGVLRWVVAERGQ